MLLARAIALCLLTLVSPLAAVVVAEEIPVEELVARLGSAEQMTRENALFHLAQRGGHAREAIPQIAATLNDPAERVRIYAAQALGRIGPPDEIGGPALLAALDDPSLSVRIAALQALRNRNWERATVIQKALPLATHESWPVRVAVADLLWHVRETKDQPALEQAVHAALLKLVVDEYPLVRQSAARGLGGLKRDAAATVPLLIAAADDDDWRVRREALGALGAYGEEAAAATDVLVKHLSDSDWEARLRAAQSLRSVNPTGALNLLLAAMKSGNELTRSTCVEALGRYGRDEPIVQALVGALADGSADVRFRAVRALDAMGPAAAPALEVLTKATADRNCIVREYACRAIGKQGPAAAAVAMPALLVALDNWHAGTRREAEAAIKLLQPPPAAPAAAQ